MGHHRRRIPGRRLVALLVPALLLAACGGGGSSSKPAPARIAVSPVGVFFTSVGQSRTLTATVLDPAGQVVSAPVTWTSSAPAQVSVDANGKLVALSIGSAQVVAQAGGIPSTPVLVIVAEPAPGTLLVTDAQVVSVGDVLGLAAGDVPDLGMQYEVRLQGVSPPPDPGTIVLAAELAPVAGRVVSTRMEGDLLVVVLELVTLPELVQNASINWNIDLSQVPWTDAPAAGMPLSAGALRSGLEGQSFPLLGGGDVPLKPFQPFTCSADFSLDLLSVTHSVTPRAQLNFVYAAGVADGLANGEARVEVGGTLTLDVLVKIALQGGIKGKAGCVVQQLGVIPVFGWFSVILAPAVRVGLGLDLSAELIASVAELDLEGQAGISFSMGISCPAGADCTEVQSFTPIGEVDPTLSVRSSPALRLILDGYLYGSVSLDAAVGGGRVGDVELLNAKIGPDQTTDVALEDAQAKDTSYASSDTLKWKGSLNALGGVAKILTELGATGASTAVSKLQYSYSHDICRSPTGALSVSKTQAGVGQNVLLSVDLDSSHVDYVGFPYNVESVAVWRLAPGGTDYQPLRVATLYPTPASGILHFEGEWTPTADDLGTNTLAAFVGTKLDTDVAYELAADSTKQVDVLCWTPANVVAGVSATAQPLSATCEDSWVGTSSSLIADAVPIDASIKWVLDTGTTVPGAGVYYYYPIGTVSVHDWINSQGCTVSYSPSSYQISTQGDPSGTGQLIIDMTATPPTYGGSGVTQWAAAMTTACPDGSGGTVPVTIAGGAWFSGTGDLSADQLSFSGTSSSLGQTFTYAFSRP